MKNPNKNFFVVFRILLIGTLLFSACKKDENNDPDPIPPSGPTLKTTVTGRVTDTDGNTLSGVQVKLGSITSTTDFNGNFLIKDTEVPKDRFVVTGTKSGYFNCIRAKKTQSGDANYINLVMQELPPVVNIPGTTGGVANIPGGATITFPANAFVDQNGFAYTGQVKVYARHFSPGVDNFEAIVPGGDLLGVSTAGDEQSLYSLGMIEAKLYDNTGLNEIKIAPGKTAALKVPIDASQNSVALSTIPMWHLDEETGIWQEEGTGIKSGNFYLANVSHFSTWNYDYKGERTDIKGMVVDCQNIPLANMVVTIDGFMNVTTDNTGAFTTWVPAGFLIECQVLQIFNPQLTANSLVQSVTAISGTINNIPTLNVSCASRITGTIKNCNTNNNESGLIQALWDGGETYYFTNDGNYNILVPVSTEVNLNASNFSNSSSINVTTDLPGIVVQAPDITLCSTVFNGESSVTVNENGNSITYELNATSTQAFYDSIGHCHIYIEGTTVPGNVSYLLAIDFIQQNGNVYNFGAGGNAIVNLDIGNSSYWDAGMFNATSNTLNILNYGVPGTYLFGHFEFGASGGTSVTNGWFSALRDN